LTTSDLAVNCSQGILLPKRCNFINLRSRFEGGGEKDKGEELGEAVEGGG
jgi:hypothetical protein